MKRSPLQRLSWWKKSNFFRGMKAPSFCWAHACPVTAVCQTRTPWRFLSRVWRKWSEFWRWIRYTSSETRECFCAALLRLLNNTFLCPCQKCDASKHKVLVASVCPQSLPFFAVKFGVDIAEAAHKLCGFLKHIGDLSFFSFMKYEVDFTISFLLSPFCFFLLLACFVILKQATFFFFFLAVLPTFLLNRLKFTFLQAGVHGLPVRPGIYHTCSTFPCLLCAFCFVTLGFPCRSAICVWHHSGSWLQHPRESKGVYSAISQEAPWFPRPAHVHLLLSR